MAGDHPPGSTIQGVGAVLGGIQAQGYARVRTDLDVQYLLAAASLARDVHAVEGSNAERPFGDFFEKVLGYSTGCVVLAAASLEAYVNQLFADRAQHFSVHDETVVDLIWTEYEKKSALEKFGLALSLRTGTRLDRGRATSQSIDRLIRLRNALVHFSPEWFDELGKHVQLSKQLEHYAGRSPWFPDEPLFPRAWATSSTTAWAITSVRQFVTAFAVASGLPDRFEKFSGRLSTKPEP